MMPTHFVNRNQIRTQKCPTMWCTRSQVHMCKYVDQMAWLPCWLTRGQQVNLRNPLHTGNEACKQGILPDFETKVDVTRSPNRGVVAPQKGLMSLNKKKTDDNWNNIQCVLKQVDQLCFKPIPCF